jgi:hypothetical protein
LRDDEVTELSGRHFLISQLLAGGVEVALPVRDRGIDLIAYLDRSGDARQFLACPIQLKANQEARFGLDRKYAAIRNLLMVHVWHVGDPARTAVYALTYAESLAILEARGHTRTSSWIDKGGYSLSVNEIWIEILKPYRMVPESWAAKVCSVASKAAGLQN